MRPLDVAPGEPSVWLPLCYGPNELRNNLRGLLTRWTHLNLRVRNVTVKLWTKELDCQVAAGGEEIETKQSHFTKVK
jgi:hypothetical protein